MLADGLTDLVSPVTRIQFGGWLHLLLFGASIPLIVVLVTRHVQRTGPPPERMQQFLNAAGSAVGLGGFSLWIAHDQGIDLFPRSIPTLFSIGAGLVLFVTMLIVAPRFCCPAVERQARGRSLSSPVNATERVMWITISVLAGVGEEITWRGVQTVLLHSLLANYGLATLTCAVMFGAAHYSQGWRAAVGSAIFALGWGGLVWLSGSLYVAMAVHIAYNITIGLRNGRFERGLQQQRDDVMESEPG